MRTRGRRMVKRTLMMRILVVVGLTTCLTHAAEADDGVEPSAESPGQLETIAAVAAPIYDVHHDLLQTVAHQQRAKCNHDHRSCECRRKRIAGLWDSDLEIGLNGAEGNSRNVNLVLGYDAKREQGRTTTTLDIDYLYSKDEVETTKNRLYSLTRVEYDTPNSDWGWFFDNWFEHDPLEDFRSRLGLHVGRFVTLLETDDCVFKGLVGVGSTKEFEGDDTDWTPELYLGSALEKSINDRQDVYVRYIFAPDIGDFGSFRFRLKAGWDFALNEEKNLKLSLSAFDRYDSTPSGTDRRNDIDYWASLVWSC